MNGFIDFVNICFKIRLLIPLRLPIVKVLKEGFRDYGFEFLREKLLTLGFSRLLCKLKDRFYCQNTIFLNRVFYNSLVSLFWISC